MRNPFSMFSVPICFPSYFFKDPYLRFQAINSSSGEESKGKSTTFAMAEVVGVNIHSAFPLAFLLPSPVSHFQGAKGWGGGRELLSQDTIAQPGENPLPCSSLWSVRYWPQCNWIPNQPVDPFRCGISCTSAFAFVLDVLLTKAGNLTEAIRLPCWAIILPSVV